MEETLNTQEFDPIKKFKEFEKRSRKKWKSTLNRIKEDRKYLGGDQLAKEDVDILGKDRASNKLNIVANAVRTIVNTYREQPYRWRVVDNSTGKDSELLNQAGITFLESPENSTACLEGLESSVSFGLGVLVITTDYGVDGNPEPTLYTITDLENVYLDPEMTKLNGSDANEAAIVELKSRRWVENNYGIDISTLDQPAVDISQDYDRKEYMPLVTYWAKRQGQVTCYRLIGNDIVEAIELPMTYIPVIPLFGEKFYDGEEELWHGIVDQMKGVQKLINYSYSNILVRLATSPKNTWICESESIEGNEKYFRDSNKTLNPLLIYNKWSADGKRELEAPQRISNEIQLGDVGEMFSQSLQMVNAIVGIPAIGLESETEKTATEVLTASKVFQNNIRSYIYNLRSSLAVAGMCLFEMIQGQPLYGAIKITCVQGPDDALKKQEARVILQQMAPLITEPQDQRKLLIAMANVEQDNEYVRTLVEMLQPMPTAQELQDQELINQANQEIKNRDVQIAQLQKQLEDEKRQSELKGYALQREFSLEELKHRNQLEQMILQAKLDGQLSEADLIKLAADQEKEKMELEKKAIELDSAERKANAENLKTASQTALNVSKFKNEMAKQETIKLKNQKQRKEVENG